MKMATKAGAPRIIVHGGAGEWPMRMHHEALAGVQAAASRGFKILTRRGGTAREAVEAAIIVLEDNPIFNAGTGSTMNLEGKVENDAAIMDGRSLESGAVALVVGVKNPIRLARIVMENTDHVLIAGTTAKRLARAYNLAQASPVVPARLANWRRERASFETGNPKHFPRNSRLRKKGILAQVMDTVGALALDSSGNVAAGASTGGVTLKLPGRIGDSALIGSGVYADLRLGAATATGMGELAIRTVISKSACDLMTSSSAQSAASRAIRDARDRVGRGLGIITLDRQGRIGVSHTTRHLCWAANGKEGLVASMRGTKI